MLLWTNDPVADYNRYCDYLEQEESKLPECCCCMERIKDDFCYEIEGDIWCEECMNDEFRRLTENLMSE